jgi:hypothetical protein
MSSEVMNTNMELIYFSWIMENPDQFSKVEPAFFKKDEIQFVYNIIREHYINSPKKNIPSPKQILQMVQLHDPEGKITPTILKTMLSQNTSDYGTDWIEPRFKAWKLSNSMRNRVMNGVEMIRGMDDINYEKVVELSGTLKTMFNDLLLIDDDDTDLGNSFYEPESHIQPKTTMNIPTGWPSIDEILGGGWSHGTLSILLGQTNVGKCVGVNTLIKIRNKKTGEIKNITIGEFYQIMKNKK